MRNSHKSQSSDKDIRHRLKKFIFLNDKAFPRDFFYENYEPTPLHHPHNLPHSHSHSHHHYNHHSQQPYQPIITPYDNNPSSIIATTTTTTSTSISSSTRNGFNNDQPHHYHQLVNFDPNNNNHYPMALLTTTMMMKLDPQLNAYSTKNLNDPHHHHHLYTTNTPNAYSTTTTTNNANPIIKHIQPTLPQPILTTPLSSSQRQLHLPIPSRIPLRQIDLNISDINLSRVEAMPRVEVMQRAEMKNPKGIMNSRNNELRASASGAGGSSGSTGGDIGVGASGNNYAYLKTEHSNTTTPIMIQDEYITSMPMANTDEGKDKDKDKDNDEEEYADSCESSKRVKSILRPHHQKYSSVNILHAKGIGSSANSNGGSLKAKVKECMTSPSRELLLMSKDSLSLYMCTICKIGRENLLEDSTTTLNTTTMMNCMRDTPGFKTIESNKANSNVKKIRRTNISRKKLDLNVALSGPGGALSGPRDALSGAGGALSGFGDEEDGKSIALGDSSQGTNGSGASRRSANSSSTTRHCNTGSSTNHRANGSGGNGSGINTGTNANGLSGGINSNTSAYGPNGGSIIHHTNTNLNAFHDDEVINANNNHTNNTNHTNHTNHISHTSHTNHINHTNHTNHSNNNDNDDYDDEYYYHPPNSNPNNSDSNKSSLLLTMSKDPKSCIQNHRKYYTTLDNDSTITNSKSTLTPTPTIRTTRTLQQPESIHIHDDLNTQQPQGTTSSTTKIRFDNFGRKYNLKKNMNIEIASFYNQKENIDIMNTFYVKPQHNTNKIMNGQMNGIMANQQSSKSGFLPKLFIRENF